MKLNLALGTKLNVGNYSNISVEVSCESVTADDPFVIDTGKQALIAKEFDLLHKQFDLLHKQLEEQLLDKLGKLYKTLQDEGLVQ